MLGKLIKSIFWTIAVLAFLAVSLILAGGSSDRQFVLFIITAILAAAISGWRASKKRGLYMETPTTHITQSSSGRVELRGHAEAYRGQLLRDPIQNEECVWFAIKSFRGLWPELNDADHSIAMAGSSKSATGILKEAVSSRPFALRDESGICVVDPGGAEFDLQSEATVCDSDHAVTHLIWRIRPEQPLTILGDFELRLEGRSRGCVSKSDKWPLMISRRTPAELEKS